MKKKTIKNIIILFALIVLTFIFVFRGQDFKEIIRVSLSVNYKYILFGTLAMIMYLLGEAINIKLILKKLGDKVRLKNTFKYSLIGFFFSGITPAATGGQPMQIYTMYRDNIKVDRSTLAVVVHLCCYQISTIILGVIGGVINHEFLSGGLVWLYIAGITLNAVVCIAMFVCLLSPVLAHKIVNLFLKLLKKFKYKKYDKVEASVEETVNKYIEGTRFIKQHKIIFFKALLVVMIQEIAYYSIPYFVYRSFGLTEYSWLRMVSIQAMLFSSVSCMPLPGAVGVSENAFLRIYQKVFKTEYLSSAMVLNRTINFYFFMIVGLVVTFMTYVAPKLKRKE